MELARYEALRGQLYLLYGRKDSYWRRMSKDKSLKWGGQKYKIFSCSYGGKEEEKDGSEAESGREVDERAESYKDGSGQIL